MILHNDLHTYQTETVHCQQGELMQEHISWRQGQGSKREEEYKDYVQRWL